MAHRHGPDYARGSLADDELRRRLRAARVEFYTPSTITDFGALLERVAEDRARGFSIVDEELERGLRSISVIHNASRSSDWSY